ncbi:amidohydrolase [Conexibacter woesei]|uniref:amidohydrolase n=1 Tax=Conexibacter woesei TaxID=191495 RepID=UPI001E446D0F|nr:amidohydrolase [Conexibacter woesei]
MRRRSLAEPSRAVPNRAVPSRALALPRSAAMARALAVAGCAAVALPGAAQAAAPKPADTVLRHGYVATVDHTNSVAQAVAIRNGRIAYVGSDRGVKAYISHQTKVIDLKGRMVMPGLVDAHDHAIDGGTQLLACDLDYAPLTVAQFQQRIQACLDRTKDKEPDGYLQVTNWYRQAMRPSGTQVSKTDLDALSTKRPIVVMSTDGHTQLLNSRALADAKITAATPDPVSGRVIKGADGQPTGILEDAAGGLVATPAPTAADTLSSATASLTAMRAQGLTTVSPQSINTAGIKAYDTLAKDDKLTTRMFMAPDIETSAANDPAKAVRSVLAIRRQFDDGPLAPRAGITVHDSGEIFQDGVLQWPAQTASLLKPYLVNKGTDAAPDWQPGPSSGPDPYIKLPVLKKLVLALAKAGISPEIHAIGDRAVRHTLDAYAYVRRFPKYDGVRLQIAHAEMVDPADYDRFKQLDVTADMGFQWAKPAFDSIDAAKDYLGPARFNRMEPEGTLYRHGAIVAQGSDWPVDKLDQFFSMEVLVTRRGDLGGQYAGPLGKVPGVPIKAALRMFTINGAYALGADRETGSLERGKLADMVVLSQNLLKIPSSRISDTKVLRTIVGGRTVYTAAR